MNAHKEILFLISTKEVFRKIRNETFEFIRVISETNIDARILIAESDELQDFAYELNKYSRINFQRLYKSVNKNSALFVIDSRSLLDLEFRKGPDISNSDNKILVYSNKEERVQTYLALFENYWILPLIHEKIPNR